MSEAVDVYVLDTSAWLTLIEDESGADTVVQTVSEFQLTGRVAIVEPSRVRYRLGSQAPPS